MESRPHYETPENRKAQAEVEAVIRKYWNVEPKRIPESYRIDCCLVKRSSEQEIGGWLEIKVRTNTSVTYPTYMIALGKWSAGMDLEQKTGLPFILAVRFTDCIMACRPSQHAAVSKFCWGGRTLNTRDPADIEPVVHIPMSCFKPVPDPGAKKDDHDQDDSQSG